MTPFDQAWAVLKMPFVPPSDLPDYVHHGIAFGHLDSDQSEEYERDDWWVDDPKDPKAYGIHNRTDGGWTYDPAMSNEEYWNQSDEVLLIPQFEVRQDVRGTGYGREALTRFIAEALRHENMPENSRVRAQEVIPSSKGFWDKMMEENIVQDVGSQ